MGTLLAGVVILASVLVPHPIFPRFNGALTVDDQIASWMIPEAPLQAAASSWGVRFVYGGAPACRHSTPGVQVVCVVPQLSNYDGGTYRDGEGIVLYPRMLDGRHSTDIWYQSVLCHEIGNALTILGIEYHPEHGPGTHDCMSSALDGTTAYLYPPSTGLPHTSIRLRA